VTVHLFGNNGGSSVVNQSSLVFLMAWRFGAALMARSHLRLGRSSSRRLTSARCYLFCILEIFSDFSWMLLEIGIEF
jgi:hypothetical protein